jgi:hypothetical protein
VGLKEGGEEEVAIGSPGSRAPSYGHLWKGADEVNSSPPSSYGRFAAAFGTTGGGVPVPLPLAGGRGGRVDGPCP